MLCLRRLATGLTCPHMMSSHLWLLIILVFGFFWWYIHDGVHWTYFLSFRSFPIEFPSFDPSFPKLGPYFPKQGLFFLTHFLRYFFLSESSMIIRMPRRVYLLIDKFLFIHLIGFWGLWLFNFPRSFTLTFPT
jgi:hypothetical protein